MAERSVKITAPTPDPSPEGEGGSRFTPVALRLAGQAGVLLGWRPHEFWAATPAELACVLTALAGDEASAPPAANEIARLKELFPDG